MTSLELSHQDYTVAWICALPLELAAAKTMLDEIHISLSQPPSDHNVYTLGKLSGHNVVIACLPSGVYGTTSAARVLAHMLPTFPSLQFGVMVGIGGGVPGRNADIRLGDVIVSKPTATAGGVIQYDYGKAVYNGQFQRIGSLNKPPQILLTAVSQIESDYMRGKKAINDIIFDKLEKNEGLRGQFSRPNEDWLFCATYSHQESNSDCSACDRNQLINRKPRTADEPYIHYGLIASGNQVMKDAQIRDQIAQDLDIFCFEMEAAGIMDQLPCLVIRGICDYCDSHKHKEWQGYASFTAAAYAKELLAVVPAIRAKYTQSACDSLPQADSKFSVPLNMSGLPAVQNFIGRESDLEQLWNTLRPERHEVGRMRKVAILHGLGGIGKTQLAIRFARKYKDEFTAIFWLNGKDRSTLMRSLALIIPTLASAGLQKQARDPKNEEEIDKWAKQALEWLSRKGNSKWLLIFDNIDYSPQTNTDHDTKNAFDIALAFPAADHGSIIITTRLPHLSELGTSHPVSKLALNEAVELLVKSCGHSIGIAAENMRKHQDTYDLADRLDGLPLAIVVAGSYICRTGISLSKYLQLYSQSWLDLQMATPSHRHYSNGNLSTTWTISFDKIQRMYPPAAKLLLLLSIYDNREIWFDVIKQDPKATQLPSWFTEIGSCEISFSGAIQMLLDFSLVESNQGSYAMHPVVQDWCRENLGHYEQDEMRLLALKSIGYSARPSKQGEYWITQQRLLPHANQMLRLMQNGWYPQRDNMVYEAINNIGTLYRDQAKLLEAEFMYCHLLAPTWANPPVADHSTILRITHNLGLLYHIQGRFDDAEVTLKRALVHYQRMLDQGHIVVLDILHDLGMLYLSRGKLNQAKNTLLQVLKSRHKLFGLNHFSTLDTYWNLGVLFYYEANMTEGEQVVRQMTANQNTVEPDHNSLLERLESAQDTLTKSEIVILDILDRFETVYGLEHPFTLRVVNGVGLVHFQKRNLKTAEEIYQRAFTARRKVLGLDHIHTLDVMNNLANVFLHQGEIQKADQMYQQALVGSEKVLGEDHTGTLGTVNNIGVLWSYQGKMKKAEQMYERALAGSKKAVGLDHISTLGATNNLGVLYSRQGKNKKAEVMYQRALAGYGNVFRSEHLSTLTTVKNLASLYWDQGRLGEANEMYQKAAVGQTKALGPTHSITLDTIACLDNLSRGELKARDTEPMSQFVLVHRPSLLHSS